MNQITNTLIFSLFSILLSSELFAGTILLSRDKATELITSSSGPITVSTNFEISNVDLIVTSEKIATHKILRKGFILIPKKKNYNAVIVMTARNGTIYSINMRGSGIKTVFQLSDPMQTYNTMGIVFDFESGRMDTDARNIIKTILLEKKLTGFEKAPAYQAINANQYLLERVERYTGAKYVVDRWNINNTSNNTLYFEEEDFYTSGILAVAIEKNRVQPNERIFLLTIINKNSVFEAEKRGK